MDETEGKIWQSKKICFCWLAAPFDSCPIPSLKIDAHVCIFCAYEVAQSPHENSMSGANTWSVLARFGDNNWEKGEDFVKTFYVKKLVWEMEGSLRAHTHWMTLKQYDHVAKSELRWNFQKSLKFSYCRKSIRKQIQSLTSCRKKLSTSFCVCLVLWKQRNLEIRADIPMSCRRPVGSLLYATKSAFAAPNLC